MKKHLRVTGTIEDSLIETYIRAATRHVENYTRLMLSAGTAVQVFAAPNTLDSKQFFSLAVGNAISVASIQCNTIDSATTFDNDITSDWALIPDFNKPRVYAPNGLEFANDAIPYHIKITYTAGYGTGATPNDIIVAIMLICADMYENRMDSVKQLPTAAEVLLSSYVVNQGV
jgi:uncharacterized phiE125 gp8 family phage protein